MKAIIEKQKELIKFYEDYLNSIAVYLAIHHMSPSDELVEQGEKLRTELSALETEEKAHTKSANEILSSIKELKKALELIMNWDLPESGMYWDKEKKDAMSYGAAFGSNGERDYFKKIAQTALFSFGGVENKLEEYAQQSYPTDKEIEKEFPLISNSEFTANKGSGELIEMKIHNSYNHGARYGAKAIRDNKIPNE